MSDAQNSSVIPNVQTYGYAEGASNPMESAMITQRQNASDQNELNNQHGGKTKRRFKRKSKRKSKKKKKGGSRIIVPQASTNGVVAAGPTDGNSAAVTAAEHATQSNANAEYDDQVGKPGTVTQVAGGRRRKTKTKRKRKRKRKRKLLSRKSRMKKKRGGYPYQKWGCFS